MSIEYRVLCRKDPSAFLANSAEFLAWDSSTRSGSFGGLTFNLRDVDEYDPLPDAKWAGHVVAVLHFDGHHNDDDEYDAFEDWSEALAEASGGAIYSPMSGRHLYVTR